MDAPGKHPELADALHRLVEAVGPVAEPDETPEVSQVSPRARMSSARLAVLVTVAAALIAGAIVAMSVFPVSGSDPEPRTVAVRASPDDDISQLRSSLADARHEQERLAAELAQARESMRPQRWFEDKQSLTYRNPWRP